MRTYIIILATLVLLVPAIAQGQTYISGNIGSQTWTVEGSPYIVQDETYADSLTVEGGVEVYFDTRCRLRISEVFTVNGTEADSVLFSNGDTTWISIHVDCSEESINSINYAIFQGCEGTGAGPWWVGNGLFFIYSNVEIRNCTFRNNTCLQYALQAIEHWDYGHHFMIIEECDFYNNIGDGIIGLYLDEDIIIRDCRFFDNETEFIIHADRGNIHSDENWSSIIYNCQFFNNECQWVIYLYKGMIAYSIFYDTVSSNCAFLYEYPYIGYYMPKSVQNCIFWAGDSMITGQQTYTIEYCDLPFNYPGTGNICEDPLFVDPSLGNFNLNPGSPCIDAGNPSGFWYENNGSRSDIGLREEGGIIPAPAPIEFDPLWPMQEAEKSFYFFNLHPFDISILDSYLTSPENFQYDFTTPMTLEPNQSAEIPIRFTFPGYECTSDLVFTSPQFIVNDTASVFLYGPLREFTPVSGTWTAAQSPYYFDEDLIVEDGEQLVIEPGVEVYFYPTRVLQIEGNLQAIGTEQDSILFVSATPYAYDPHWGGIIYLLADGENNLEYVRVEDAEDSYPLNEERGGGIYAENTNLSLSNCTFDECRNSFGGGVYIQNCSQLIIDDCYFYGCYALVPNGGGVGFDGGAIYASNIPQVEVKNSYFEECKAWGYGGSFYFDNCSALIDSSITYYSDILGDFTGISAYVNNCEIDINRSLFTYSSGDGMYLYGVIALNNSSVVNIDHSDICYIPWIQPVVAIEVIDENSQANISNSIIYDLGDSILFTAPNPNQIIVTYSLIPEVWPGVGNIQGDPLITENFELTYYSPCIDAGDPSYPLDPDSTRTDMGAYYYDQNVYIGAVSGLWTAEHNPYVIVGNIYVPGGDTLTVMPGTIVEFETICDLSINGVLLVYGTAEDTVKFIGVTPTQTDGVDFYFNGTSGSSILEYGRFQIIKHHMGPFPTTFNHCYITVGIDGETSSGNTVTNSKIYGWIYQGFDWAVSENYIDFSAGAWLGCTANTISSASGSFINNEVHAHAWSSYEYGSSVARSFYQCEGTIAHNYTYASATAQGSGWESGHGISLCNGTIRHNCVEVETNGITGCTGEIFNNTLIDCEIGIRTDDPIDPVKNNIVYNCDTGFYGPFEVQYSCVYNCPTPFANGATAGVGTIEEDPLLIDTWFLDPNSPCIDAGDPDPVYNDPDGTRDDMGANYFDQGAAYATIVLTPYNPPIQIPASGGAFDYNIEVANTGVNPVTGDVWCNVILPNGTVYGPLLGPVSVTLSGGFIGDRDRTQTVPAAAPEGSYTYQGWLGLYPDTVWDMDSFAFEKLSTGDGIPVEDWQNTGESFDDWMTPPEAATLPESYELHQNYPNPFNPITTINFALPEASYVKLQIFNVAGRLVESLLQGWREAGYHEVTFNASNLASGLYFYRIEAGDFAAVKKMVLMK